MRALAPIFLSVTLILVSGCDEPVITEDQTLGAVVVPAKTLERGRRVYNRYCVTCHGAKGDGKGVQAYGQWPPPRDFRSAKFKFAGIADRGLPADAELARIIRGGLAGTYMRPWSLSELELDAVIQYLKTFSAEGKGFRKERLKVKAPVIPEPPYREQRDIDGAVERGERLYHEMFQCGSCHPAYVTRDKARRWELELRAEGPFDPVPKWSENYRSVLEPPDFLRHTMRAVRGSEAKANPRHRLGDIYRAIAYGLQGPMPGYLHLGEDKVWDVSYYVKWLADQRLTREGLDLRKALLDSESTRASD